MQIRCNFPDISYLSETQKNNFQFLSVTCYAHSCLFGLLKLALILYFDVVWAFGFEAIKVKQVPNFKLRLMHYYGRPWPALYITFNQNTHQIQVLTKPLCRAQAIFYSLSNNEWGTKYRGLTYSAK